MTMVSSAFVLSPDHSAAGLLTVTIPRSGGRPFIHFDHHIGSDEEPLVLPDWLEENLVDHGPLVCAGNPLDYCSTGIRPRDHPTVTALQSRQCDRIAVCPMPALPAATTSELVIATGQLWLKWAAESALEGSAAAAVNRWVKNAMPGHIEHYSHGTPVTALDGPPLEVSTAMGTDVAGLRRLKACFVTKLSCKPGYREHSSRTACELYAYTHRLRLENPDGTIHDFALRGGDLVGSMLYFPPRVTPMTSLRLWRAADRAAADFGDTGVSSVHIVADLPPGDLLSWFQLVSEFVRAELLIFDIAVEAIIHDPGRKGGEGNPHVHFQVCSRSLDEQGRFVRFLPELCNSPVHRRWRQRWDAALANDLKIKIAGLICKDLRAA